MLCPDASWYGLFKRLFYLCSDSSNPVPVLCKPKWTQLGEHVDYAWQCVKSCLPTDDGSGEGCSRAFCKEFTNQKTVKFNATEHIQHWYHRRTCQDMFRSWLSILQFKVSDRFTSPQIKWEFLFLLQNICMLSQSAGCFSGVTITTRSLFPNRPKSSSPVLLFGALCTVVFLMFCSACVLLLQWSTEWSESKSAVQAL